MTGMSSIGERLRRARGKMPQRELARRSGVSQASISMIEAGRQPKPSPETLIALEDALGLLHGTLSRPGADMDPSLAAYLASQYAADQRPTEAEVEILQTASWKGPRQDASPAAWARLLEAIRMLPRR